MSKLKNDKIKMLEALRDLVEEGMENSLLNPYDEQGISEFISDITDKRRVRRLKKLKRELNKFIEETVVQEKLMNEEREYNNQERIKNEKIYNQRANDY